MPREPLSAERKAWLRGERIERFKLRYNERVRIVRGPEKGSIGWIVGVDPHATPEPVYTVETSDGESNAEYLESFIEPVA